VFRIPLDRHGSNNEGWYVEGKYETIRINDKKPYKYKFRMQSYIYYPEGLSNVKRHIKAFILGYENKPGIELIKCMWTPKNLILTSRTGKMSASKFSKQ
jgi:hypothetical protein